MNRDKFPYQQLLFFIACIICSIAVYHSGLFFQFTYLDDYVQVVDNPSIKALDFSSIQQIFTTTTVGMYQPMTTLFYAVIYSIAEHNPFAYHLSSLIIHLLNTVLVFKLLKHFFTTTSLLYLLTLIFCFHPMQVESISWVSAFSNLLCTFFFLLSLLNYLSYSSTNKKTTYFLSLLLFIIACLSKSAAVVLPIVLIAVDWFNKKSFKLSFLLNKSPFLLVSIVFGIVTIISRETSGHLSDLSTQFDLLDRILLVSHSILFYPINFIAPVNLSAFYPYPEVTDRSLPIEYYFSPLFLLATLALLFRFRKNKKYLFGTLFFLITIGLVVQIVPVGNQLTTDRYIYIPIIGLLIILGTLISKLKNNKIIFALYSIPIAFMFLSHQQSKIWKNDEVLWKSVLKHYPNVAQAYNNLGAYAFKQNQASQALVYYNKAIALQSNYADAYTNRGNLMANQGKTALAIKDFSSAIQFKPHPDAYFNRANELSQLGNFNSAEADYSESIRLKPRADSYTNRAFNYLKMNKTTLAQQDLRRAVALDRNFSRAYFLLGMIEQRGGNNQKACQYLSKAANLGEKNAALAFNQHCR